MTKQDQKYMKLALELAAKAQGRTAPNPCVGAVIVRAGKIIGQGYHKKAGGSHAEVEALRSVYNRRRTTVCSPNKIQRGNGSAPTVKGATIYVTMEPCCHHGKTPPCTEAIIRAGIKRVVVAVKDPNPLVAGRGIVCLRRYGIQAEIGLMKQEAVELNKDFFHYITSKRPYVYLKAAMTRDGKIAVNRKQTVNRRRTNRRRQWLLPPTKEKWITRPQARQWVHQLRSRVGAILVGVGTVLADDPRLTARAGRRTIVCSPGNDRRSSDRRPNGWSPSVRQPLRVILDPRARTPSSAKVFQQPGKTLLCVGSRLPATKLRQYNRAEFLRCPVKSGKIDLHFILKELGKREIISLLVEGGAEVFTSFIDQTLVNRYYFFIAPKVYGDEGLDFYRGKNKDLRLMINEAKKVGKDLLIEAKR